jgi:hypothetical protein
MNEHAFRYEQIDIPAGLTIREWRVARHVPAARRGLLARLLRAA